MELAAGVPRDALHILQATAGISMACKLGVRSKASRRLRGDAAGFGVSRNALYILQGAAHVRVVRQHGVRSKASLELRVLMGRS